MERHDAESVQRTILASVKRLLKLINRLLLFGIKYNSVFSLMFDDFMSNPIFGKPLVTRTVYMTRDQNAEKRGFSQVQ
ncbi:hypothetical protein [Desulfosporosinus sp. BG]|uniref:hypothetical protein n=1 Tax=Desulfosporosinus sp. BG TaxID=1633135 RepID=UPI00159F0136|nr:hypothetical protein [Desulfosporosinus sp. BG]